MSKISSIILAILVKIKVVLLEVFNRCSNRTLSIYVTDGKVGRTTSMPNSALRLIVDKDQGLLYTVLNHLCYIHSKNTATVPSIHSV